jgi:hypothetical protein
MTEQSLFKIKFLYTFKLGIFNSVPDRINDTSIQPGKAKSIVFEIFVTKLRNCRESFHKNFWENFEI